MQVDFAPGHIAISDRLRRRFESWQEMLPSSQHQQYGPINMLLTAIFSNENFLVKPQALYRPILRTTLGTEDVQAVVTGIIEPNMDVDSMLSLQEDLVMNRLSIDSGKHVVETGGGGGKQYPDFAVTIYGSVIRRKEPANLTGAARVSDDGDVTRIIIEIGSAPRNAPITKVVKVSILAQLRSYMDRLGTNGERWDTDSCGIAIIGTEYARIYHRKNRDGDTALTKTASWASIYDSSFILLLEKYAVVDMGRGNGP